ncbi:transposable element Tcb1 transposase [Trichonephila clavipes]|nr:transposable element Tcb1 transposase [Trichonephila clavipes]
MLHQHVARNVRYFFSAQHMQLIPWPAYSPDMSPIEYVLNLVGQLLTPDPRTTASKDEIWVHTQTIGNSLPQEDIQHLFDSMPHRKAALIAACGGYIKYYFST